MSEPTTRTGSWSAKWARRFDVGLVVVLMLPVLMFPFTGVGWPITLLCAAQILPLVLRRRRPLLCAAAVAALAGLLACVVPARRGARIVPAEGLTVE